jgi:cytidylate kinase
VIICLIGGTCAGKTTTGKALAELLGWPFRSCGSAVRRRAELLGIPFLRLAGVDHRIVDDETVAWAIGHSDCLVEGRFLDAVFGQAAVPAATIRLTANAATRAARARLRGMFTFSEDDVLREDASDTLFRSRLYRACPELPSTPVVDSSDLTVSECVSRVSEILGLASFPPG